MGLVFFETLKNTDKNTKERKTSQINPNHKERVDKNSKRFSQTIIFCIRMSFLFNIFRFHFERLLKFFSALFHKGYKK